MIEIIEDFRKNASSASYHYADDSCREWGHAKECVRKCRELLHNHPEHREEFLEIAKTQLCAGEITKGYKV